MSEEDEYEEDVSMFTDMPIELIRNDYITMVRDNDPSMMHDLKRRLEKIMPDGTPPIIYMLMAVSMDKFNAVLLVNEIAKLVAVVENDEDTIDIRRLCDE